MLFLLLVACSDYNVVPKPVDVDPGDVTECGFTRVGDTAFYGYDCNPVFTTTGEAWAGEVGSTAFAVTRVLDHPFYQLWYVTYPTDDTYAVGYAVSAEGTAWTPWPDNPGLVSSDNQDFDKTVMQANQVIWDPATIQYVMLYGGLDLSSAQGGGGIGVATSADGSQWTRIGKNPVVELSPSGVKGVESWCWPLDLNLVPTGGYTGYIAGSVSGGACEAYPIDGSAPDAWTISPEPAFGAGENGEWDDEGIISLNEASLEADDFLFYVGFGNWEDHGYYRTATNSFLGMARKNQKGHWDRDPEPVPINTTEQGDVSAVAAVTVGERIALWVTDEWDGASAVGYFLYDPVRAAQEDGG